MDYSLHTYEKSTSYSTEMDLPSANQALFALVVMIIVLLFILVYCCSGAFPCTNNNYPGENVTSLDPTGRRIRYPLLPRTRGQSSADDQDVSRDRSSSRRSAVVIVPVNGIMYCCDDNMEGSLSGSMRSKPPAYGDLFKAPPPYSVRTKTPSPTSEIESVFPPAYEDSFKDWKLTFDNDNRFDSLHEPADSNANSERLNGLIYATTSASSVTGSHNLATNIIDILAKDYSSACATETTAATTSAVTTAAATPAATTSEEDSWKALRTFFKNEHPAQRGLEASTLSSHTSHSVDDLNNRISSLDESPVPVNFNSRLSADPDTVYIGPGRRHLRGSRVHGSYKFSRSASANLPDDSSYYSNNDLGVSGQQRWSTESSRGLDVFEQQRRPREGNGHLGGSNLQRRLAVGVRDLSAYQRQTSERNREMFGKQSTSREGNACEHHLQSKDSNRYSEATSQQRQISEPVYRNIFELSSNKVDPDIHSTQSSEGNFSNLGVTNGSRISISVPLNDLNSEGRKSCSLFYFSAMNIVENQGSNLNHELAKGGDSFPQMHGAPACPQASVLFKAPVLQASSIEGQSVNHSRSSSNLYPSNNHRSLETNSRNFPERVHASSLVGNSRTVCGETVPEFQNESSSRSGPKVLPSRVPDSDVYGLIRELTAAENQRRELPILDRTKAYDSLDFSSE